MVEPAANLEAEDPWVCPNDRELSLRAKLDSGWSFYTNRQNAGRKLTIKKEEVTVIEGIVKKAEEVTSREEYRIGRLVDRLENIKNNAQGNGITTCLLCDEKFGKITATPMKCNICEKAACGKCGVETMSSGNVPIFLCKLCNEQREFWKKSGAWFFRQLPKHELPPARERNILTSGSFIVSTPEMTSDQKGNLLSQTSILYSDSDVESSLSSEELIDEQNQLRFGKHRKSPRPSDAKQQPGYNARGKHNQLDDSDDEHMDSSDGFGARRSPMLKVDDDRSSLARSETPSSIASDHRGSSRRNSLEMSDDDDESRTSKILRHSPLMVRKNKRPSAHSLNSTGSSRSGSLTGDVTTTDPSKSQSHDNGDIEDGASSKDIKGPLGVIEFTVNYIKEDRRLDVHIHNAKGLRAMDASGFSDPYVKAHLLPGASKGNKTRTRTLQKTLDPIFNETLTYHGITEDDMKNKTLRIQVLDEDRVKRNDFIGQTTIPLKRILVTNNKKMQKILEPKSEAEIETAVPADSPGRIYISLCYVSKENKLYVGIIRCANLIAMDANGYSDPYVKCYLLPDPNKKTKRRTKHKSRNLNPEFNVKFSYKIEHNDLANRTLEVTVWDYDVGRSNDFIGGIHLGIHSKDLLLKQWFETLKYPNKESKYWHVLTRDIVLNEADE